MDCCRLLWIAAACCGLLPLAVACCGFIGPISIVELRPPRTRRCACGPPRLASLSAPRRLHSKRSSEQTLAVSAVFEIRRNSLCFFVAHDSIISTHKGFARALQWLRCGFAKTLMARRLRHRSHLASRRLRGAVQGCAAASSGPDLGFFVGTEAPPLESARQSKLWSSALDLRFAELLCACFAAHDSVVDTHKGFATAARHFFGRFNGPAPALPPLIGSAADSRGLIGALDRSSATPPLSPGHTRRLRLLAPGAARLGASAHGHKRFRNFGTDPHRRKKTPPRKNVHLRPQGYI